jgi:hypothetical protein
VPHSLRFSFLQRVRFRLALPNPKKIEKYTPAHTCNHGIRVPVQMLTACKSLHSVSWLPIIVVMRIGIRIGANEGGQQPSERAYSANLKMPRAPMQTSTKTSRFYVKLNRQTQEVETTLSYRKQRTANRSNRQKIDKWKSRFSALHPSIFCAGANVFSASKTHQHPAAQSTQSVECHALPRNGIQNRCGIIIIWGTARSHGTTAIL